jgi:CRISPR-associated endonuclease Csn1
LDDREYKQFYYAANSENYAYAFYQGIIKNKIERYFKIINLFEIASKLKISEPNQLFIEPEIEFKKGEKLYFYTLLKIGQKVLFYKNDPDELKYFSKDEISIRLYKIIEFEKDGRIKFKHHIDARKDEALGKGDSIIDYNKPKGKLRLSKGNFNFIIEGKDFNIEPDGKIRWL